MAKAGQTKHSISLSLSFFSRRARKKRAKRGAREEEVTERGKEKKRGGGGWRKEEVEEVPCNNGGKRRKQGRHYSSSRGGRRSVRSKHAFHKHTIGRTDGVVAFDCSVHFPTLRMDVAGTKQERENGKKRGKSGRGGLRKKERKKNSREWATSWQKERMRKGERRSFTRTKKCWLLE